MKERTLVYIVSLSVAMAACTSQPPDPLDDLGPIDTAASAETAPAGATDQSEGASGQALPEGTVLPDTAGPLPLAGLAGLLSLGIAIGLRAGRR
jgi:hypothetical protein